VSACTLVTGATGFFGGNLARALCERGERIRILARPGSRPVALEGLSYEVAHGDLLDPPSLTAAVAACRRVYHAAASVTFWCRTSREFDAVRRVNVEGTRLLLQAASRAGVERVVHVSTVDAIGLPPAGRIADESTAGECRPIATVYAATKREAEETALASEVDTVVVNPAFMLGGYDPKPTSGRLLTPIVGGPFVICPREGGNNFVAVADVVAGTLAAMERGRRGERYILGHENLTYRALFTRALAIAGRRPWLVTVPPVVLVSAARLMEGAARVFRAEPQLTVSLAHLAFADHYYDSSKAVRELGLPQTPIDDALGEALAWLARRART
jgi:dihydroflavonol-4-reductase